MKNSRDMILEEIISSNIDDNEIYKYSFKGIEYANKLDQFIKMLKKNGGVAIEVIEETELENHLLQFNTKGKVLFNVLQNDKLDYPNEILYSTKVAIMRANIAVAENAAIWVEEKNMGNRLLPFVSEELVLIIKEKNIVDNMHQAYNLIDISSGGFGVFISGPSKTADIEQCLVIGAHGPIYLTVFILKN